MNQKIVIESEDSDEELIEEKNKKNFKKKRILKKY